MKLDDVPFIVRDMKKEMPIHTKQSAQVPCSFVRGLPKNLMDWSAHVDNKFLNNHLHEIEEFYHRFPQFHSKQFEKYQLATYGAKYDILNHDGFFNDEKIKDWHSRILKGEAVVKGASLMIPSSYVTHPAAGGGGCTEGSELETYPTDNNGFSFADYLVGAKVTSTINTCYDQISGKFTGSGNVYLGVYDSDGEPNNLEVTTSSLTLFTDYAYKTVTEFNTDTAEQWIMCVMSGSGSLRQQTAVTNTEYHAHTFGALPDPANDTTTHSGRASRLKMRHS